MLLPPSLSKELKIDKVMATSHNSQIWPDQPVQFLTSWMIEKNYDTIMLYVALKQQGHLF